MTNIKIVLNRLIATSMLCIVITILLAQSSPLNKVWDKRFGGVVQPSNIFLGSIFTGAPEFAMAQGQDAGVLIGNSVSSDSGNDKSLPSKGMFDYWVIKLDAGGKKIWDRDLGGNDQDFLYSISSTSDGGILLGGSSMSDSSGDKTENSRGDYDYWLVKLDVNGNKIWDKTFGGDGGETLTSIAPTSDGGYLLGGTSGSGISGDKTQDSRGSGDYWVIKIDVNGNKIWDKRFGGTSSDWLNAIVPTSNGFLLGGVSKSGVGGDKTQPSHGQFGSYDYWVVKIDDGGNKMWDKAFGGSQSDYLTTIQPNNDGTFLLGGISNSPADGDKTQGTQGFDDYWIIKIDSNGNKMWDQRYGGTNYDYLWSILNTNDGGYFLSGSSQSGIGGDKTGNNCTDSLSDMWLIKINANGNKIWDKTYGGDSSDNCGASLITKDGSLLLGGFSASQISCYKSQPCYFHNKYGADYWVIKLADSATLVTLNEDRDGLNDFEEIIYATDPANFDTNGDGLADGVNVFSGLLPLNADTDGDNITNAQETLNGTNPVLKDTDGDGVPDNKDAFPLDRFRTKLPPKKAADHKAPVITLFEPLP